jgi:predicted RNA-binding Zn ribbon-like protein
MTTQGARLQAAPHIPDRLAFAAVDLLTELDLTRLRACPIDEGGCGWLFLDHSRNNSRRWCVMADCGTAAKSRKLTARRQSQRGAVRARAV